MHISRPGSQGDWERRCPGVRGCNAGWTARKRKTEAARSPAPSLSSAPLQLQNISQGSSESRGLLPLPFAIDTDRGCWRDKKETLSSPCQVMDRGLARLFLRNSAHYSQLSEARKHPAPSAPTLLRETESSLRKHEFINSLINHTSYFHGALKNKTFESTFTPTLGLRVTRVGLIIPGCR